MKYYWRGFIGHARVARDFLLDLIFPIHCLRCEVEGEWLCKKCKRKLELNTQDYCPECNEKNSYFGAFCLLCQPNKSLDGIWVAGDYQNKLLAKIIKKYKYHFIKDLNHILGEFVARYIFSLINQTRLTKLNIVSDSIWRSFDRLKKAPALLFDLGDSILIPVPLHQRRLRWRGFNQSLVLAEEIAKHFSIAVVDDCLVRQHHTKAQAKLSKKERLVNLKNCFVCRYPLKNKNIILIDDVTTTGTTLNECAKALKASGAKSIWGLVIARG